MVYTLRERRDRGVMAALFLCAMIVHYMRKEGKGMNARKKQIMKLLKLANETHLIIIIAFIRGLLFGQVKK